MLAQQMLQKVEITDAGETAFLVGDQIGPEEIVPHSGCETRAHHALLAGRKISIILLTDELCLCRYLL